MPTVANLLEAADRELHRSPDLRDVPGIKERITARFERIEAGIGRKMMDAAEFSRPWEAASAVRGLFGTDWAS